MCGSRLTPISAPDGEDVYLAAMKTNSDKICSGVQSSATICSGQDCRAVLAYTHNRAPGRRALPLYSQIAGNEVFATVLLSFYFSAG